MWHFQVVIQVTVMLMELVGVCWERTQGWNSSVLGSRPPSGLGKHRRWWRWRCRWCQISFPECFPSPGDGPRHFVSVCPLWSNKTAVRKAPSPLFVSADLGMPPAETTELVVGLGASKAVWLECLLECTLHHSASTNLISANLST